MFLSFLCNWPYCCCATALTVSNRTIIISLLLIYHLYAGYLQLRVSKKDVCRLYNVAAILLSQYTVHVMLFPTISLLRFTSALPAVCVQCPVCSSLLPYSMLFGYCLSDFELVPVAPITTGITFVLTVETCCIYIVRDLYFRNISASFLITFIIIIIIIIIIPYSVCSINTGL